VSIKLSKQAAKDLRKLEQQSQQRAKKLIVQVDQDRTIGKLLKGSLSGLWSVRLAHKYRIIYEQIDSTTYIVAITHRKDAYKP